MFHLQFKIFYLDFAEIHDKTFRYTYVLIVKVHVLTRFNNDIKFFYTGYDFDGEVIISLTIGLTHIK